MGSTTMGVDHIAAEGVPPAARGGRSYDALKTYRYLRIGMVGATVLLGFAILLEHAAVRSGCWQTSISAYYYTPVRAIFVGSLFAIGLSLIVYKGASAWEDVWLTFAGALAPIVAIAPTLDVGQCWSVAPTAPPVVAGGPAPWVVSVVDNNFWSLVAIGVCGAFVALFVRQLDRRVERPVNPWPDRILGAGMLFLLGGGILAHHSWDGFYTRVHGGAAIVMFVCLVLAVFATAAQHCDRAVTEGVQSRWQRITMQWEVVKECLKARGWFTVYLTAAVVMISGMALIWLTRFFANHTVLAVELWGILCFVSHWGLQTVHEWGETGMPMSTPILPVPIDKDTSALDKAVGFYRDLDFEVLERPDHAWVRYRNEDLLLLLAVRTKGRAGQQSDDARTQKRAEVPRAACYLHVRDTARFHRRCEAKGRVTWKPEDDRSGICEFDFTDSSDNRILVARLP